ncbi:MAG TPA: ABC transporter permease [Virgibacillus sp.]|nr:ABC transporter permease [Virgibacillus sp.]
MNDMYWLIRKTVLTTFRNKWNILLYVFGPVIGIVIALFAAGNQGDETTAIGVVDNDGAIMASETIDFIKDQENMTYHELTSDEADGRLADGSVEVVVTLEKGYSDSIMEGHPNHIELTSIMGESVTSTIRNNLYPFIDRLVMMAEANDGDKDAFTTMLDHYQANSFSVNVVSEDTSGGEITIASVGFLLLVMMFSACNLSEIILEEKENRTYFRLLSTPITARKYIASNLVVNTIILGVQVLIMLCALSFIFDIDMGMPFWQVVVVLWLFSLVAVGVSLVIVAYSNTRSVASGLSNLVILPTIMISGGFWPVEIMPDFLKKISEFLPQRWTLDTLERLNEGYGMSDLYINFSILIAFAVALFLIAIYKMSRNDSMRTFV